MDPKRPSHLASTVVVTTLMSMFALIIYGAQVTEQFATGRSSLQFLYANFGQGMLELAILVLSSTSMVLGLIARISTSKEFPDYSPSIFAMSFGLISFSSPFLIPLGRDFAEAQNIDPGFVGVAVFSFIATPLIVGLLIMLWSSYLRRRWLRGPRLENQRNAGTHSSKFSNSSQGVADETKTVPPATNWNGFPSNSD